MSGFYPRRHFRYKKTQSQFNTRTLLRHGPERPDQAKDSMS